MVVKQNMYCKYTDVCTLTHCMVHSAKLSGTENRTYCPDEHACITERGFSYSLFMSEIKLKYT